MTEAPGDNMQRAADPYGINKAKKKKKNINGNFDVLSALMRYSKLVCALWE